MRGDRLVVFLILATATPALAGSDVQVLEDFQSMAVGSTPGDGWKTRNGDAAPIYKIKAEDNNRYLGADDTGQSVQLFRKIEWDLAKTPRLRWKWRVREFPKGAEERTGKNDSAAALYVIFPRRWFVPEAIKYIWSETVPAGTVTRKTGHYVTIVVRTGGEISNEWREETRDVLADYLAHFEKRPAPPPQAFGFLTDANDVKGKAAADYDDLRALPASTDDADQGTLGSIKNASPRKSSTPSEPSPAATAASPPAGAPSR